MKNQPGAMFLLSWFLEELACLRFLSSAGIDAIDGRGFLDVVLSVDELKASRLFKHSYRDADDIARYVVALKNTLGQKWNRLGDPDALGEAVARAARSALKRPMPGVANVSKALVEAARIWGEFIGKLADVSPNFTDRPLDLLPDFGVSTLSAAPYFVLDHKPQGPEPLLRIEAAFSKPEIDAFASFPGGNVPYAQLKMVGRIPTQQHKQEQRNTHGIVAIEVRLTARQRAVLRQYLPQEEDAPSFTTIGLDYGSGTLSIHFKRVTESVRSFSISVPEDDSTALMSQFSLSLFKQRFDLRTLADRHEKMGRTTQHSVEFCADVANSPLCLESLGDQMCSALVTTVSDYRDSGAVPPIRVSFPCGVRGPRDVFDVACACVADTPECPNSVCRALRVRIQQRGLQFGEVARAQGKYICVGTGGRLASAWLQGGGAKSLVSFERIAEAWTYSTPISAVVASTLWDILNGGMGRGNDVSRLAQKVAGSLIAGWCKAEPVPSYESPSAGENKRGRLEFMKEEGAELAFRFKKRLKGGQNGEVWIVDVQYPFGHGPLSRGTVKLLSALKGTARPVHEGHHLRSTFVLKILPDALKSIAEAPKDFPRGTAPRAWMVRIYLDKGEERHVGVLMEKLEGQGDMEDRIRKAPHTVSLLDAASWLCLVSGMLVKWRAKSLVHWDIKPGNIFVVGNRNLKLIDFGLVGRLGADKLCRENRDRQVRLDQNLDLFGPPFHVAPEIADNRVTSEKTMVFGMGALACTLLGSGKVQNTHTRRCRPSDVPSYLEGLLGGPAYRDLKRSVAADPSQRPTMRRLCCILNELANGLRASA
ncbi:MAG TPA: protein kinase [Candidatus Paceibacterota bacterium]|nr:protein kinase [Verrucomicrobiota bacterium]HSA12884.1 protein kinase [Candidatus Paceibacterota bacterium]